MQAARGSLNKSNGNFECAREENREQTIAIIATQSGKKKILLRTTAREKSMWRVN